MQVGSVDAHVTPDVVDEAAVVVDVVVVETAAVVEVEVVELGAALELELEEALSMSAVISYKSR